MDTSKIVSYLSYVLLGVSALFAILFYTGTITEEPFLILAYILFIIAAVSTIAFALVQIFSSGKSAKRGLLYLGMLVVLVFVAWLMASPEIPQFIGADEFDITPGTSRYVGTVLFVTYILAIGAFGSMIYSEVRSFFK